MITAVSAKTNRKRHRGDALKWLRPYYEATEGGESKMIRFLDDPDSPCYVGAWLTADKNRFHTPRGPGGPKKYIMNPDLWVYPFRDSLSAVTVANEWKWWQSNVPGMGWGSKRGSTLVTPRHIISCGHGAAGGPGTADYPTKCRFLGTDGETYERTIIGQKLTLAPNYSYVLVNGVNYYGDTCISTLDEDLPAAVVPVRMIPNHYKFSSQYGRWDALFVSQSLEHDAYSPTEYGEQVRWYPLTAPWPVSHYPRRHRSMCGILGINPIDPKVGYTVWGGDSGMPLFYGYGTELLFAGFCGGGGEGARSFPLVSSGTTITWEDLVNALIHYSDADAIARGSLSSPTGYTATMANEIPALLPP